MNNLVHITRNRFGTSLARRAAVFGLAACVSVLFGAQNLTASSTHVERVLRGAMFVGVAVGNTIAATDHDGTRFHMYFLNGGAVTYMNEHGTKDSGRWRIRFEDDAVCVRWQSSNRQERCAVIRMSGNQLSLDGDIAARQAELLGTIVVGFD